jgi:hypothetical protein
MWRTYADLGGVSLNGSGSKGGGGGEGGEILHSFWVDDSQNLLEDQVWREKKKRLAWFWRGRSE